MPASEGGGVRATEGRGCGVKRKTSGDIASEFSV